MNKRMALFLLFFLLIFIVPTSLASPRTPTEPQESTSTIPIDQIIIQFKNDSTMNRQALTPNAADLMQTLSSAAEVTITYQRVMSGDAHVLQLPNKMSVSDVAAIAARLETLADVEYAEPDKFRQLFKQPEQPKFDVDATPNDSLFNQQWHYNYAAGTSEGINAVDAWDITTGNSSIVVAVIDTGILPTHPDLTGQTVQGYDFISDTLVSNDGDGRDNNPADPGDWISANLCGNGNDASDSSWHGSHVGGTIGANSNNGQGVAGVSWDSKILPVRVLGRCGGFTSDIVDGIVWAAGGSVSGVPANANPAHVINMSLGGAGVCSTSEQNAINQAVGLGTTVVVAAGNSAVDAENSSPGNCNNVINVASNNRMGDIASYSNFSTTLIDVSAPGGDTTTEQNGVLSTVDISPTSPSASTYAFYQGTSMAAPHVAGVAALMYAVNPNITPAQVEQALKSSARTFPSGSSCLMFNDCGAGIVDAPSAVIAACNVSGAKAVVGSIVNQNSGPSFFIYLPLIMKPCG